MTSPLERAGKAVEQVTGDHCGQCNLQHHWDSKDVVRAVLTAIREPSEGVLQAAEIATITARQDSFTDEWQAMIDAALSEGG